jgi:hypothetical protein
MATADYVFGNKQWEINRWLLVLSTLGLASKLLEIDLSQISIFGLNLPGKEAALVPGFIGVALSYALLTFVISRLELMLAHNDDTTAHAVSIFENSKHPKLILVMTLITFPFSALVYFIIPVGLTLFTIKLLSSDIYIVLQILWEAA